MKIKVSKAEGVVLDWLVAKCEGALSPLGNVMLKGNQRLIIAGGDIETPTVIYSPSTDWAQGGPIIEREGITVGPHQGTLAKFVAWRNAGVGAHRNEFSNYGPTPLITAMRCFVASRLGYEVEIPEELLK